MRLRHALLSGCGVAHGFGTRGASEPEGLLRPHQVHGSRVVDAEACRARATPEADAVVSSEPGVAVGVVTADCVPILLASADGGAVAAAHAGWRGLARGVVEACVDALRQAAMDRALVAVVGPHVGPCCYEVDRPVIDVLSARFGDVLDGVLGPGRPNHAQLDLGGLAQRALLRAGVADASIGRLSGVCTSCDARRFHSYRRDGVRAGRLVHFVAAAA